MITLDEIDSLPGDDSDPNRVELDRELTTGFLYARAKAKEWTEEAARLRAEIEESMGEAEDGLVDGREVIRWHRRKVNRFQQAKLKKDHPDLVAVYTDLVEERRFEVVEEDA